jgi:hypothetical protein
MKHSRGLKLRLLAGVAGAAALALAAVAWGSPVTLPGPDADPSQPIKLGAQGEAFFDPYQPPGLDAYNDECALGDDPVDEEGTGDVGFTPASDVGSDGGDSDVFDGGLILAVGDTIFEDADQTGDLVGQQLTVGPTKLEGLRVKRVETALPGSPTLRSLIKLKNKSKHKVKKRTITWDSDVGADRDEEVWATSSGDESLTDSDRWLVFIEGPDTPGDAPGTLVLSGKGKGVKQTTVADGITDQNGCVRFTVRAKVPAKSSRYLLFFTEVHDESDEGADLAASDAAKFNTKKPGGGVLAGLKKSVKAKVLNWDLVKEPKKH